MLNDMFNCKCVCCPKIGLTQDQQRLIAKGLKDKRLPAAAASERRWTSSV